MKYFTRRNLFADLLVYQTFFATNKVPFAEISRQTGSDSGCPATQAGGLAGLTV